MKKFLIIGVVILIIVFLLFTFLSTISKKKLNNNLSPTPSSYSSNNQYPNNFENQNEFNNQDYLQGENKLPTDNYYFENNPNLSSPTPTPNITSKNISALNFLFNLFVFGFNSPASSSNQNKTNKTNVDILKSKLPLKTNYFEIESYDENTGLFKANLKDPKDENIKVFESWLKIEYPDINLSNFVF